MAVRIGEVHAGKESIEGQADERHRYGNHRSVKR